MRNAPRRDERGSLAIEVAMIAPAILVLFALIYAYGRVGQVNGTLESGTRDGARSATMARSLQDARERATRVIQDALEEAPPSCRHSLQVSLVGHYLPGDPITVEAKCTYGIDDLGLPGAPGTLTAHSSFTSMLDPYRGLQ